MGTSAVQRQKRGEALLGPDVGRRIREARQARGLSMAALAGDDFSRSFISLVETGRSHISLRALAIVADRLELPIGYFLEGTDKSRAVELLLDAAAAANARQEPAEALRHLDEAEPTQAQRPRALFLRATALLNSGRPRDGLPLLQEAAELLQRRPDVELLTKVWYTAGAAAYALNSYEEALTYFRRAWDEMHKGPENPVMSGRISVSIGHILYVQGDVDGALAYYSRARESFGPLRDPITLACIYSALSLVHKQSGNTAEALHYSKLGLGVYEATSDARRAAAELNNMAVHYRELQDFENAFACAREAIEQARALAAADIEAIARSTLASIYLEHGDLAAAETEALAVDAVPVDDPGLERIDAWLVLAGVAERRNDLDASDALFRQALAALEQMDARARYIEAARAYSLLLRRRGELDKALEFALKASETRVSPRR